MTAAFSKAINALCVWIDATPLSQWMQITPWVVPTVQAHCSTYAIGTPGHSWQLTAQSKSSIGTKGMIHVAKVMAATAVDALRNPALIAQAKADYAARTESNPYVCPLPDDVTPPLRPRPAG